MKRQAVVNSMKRGGGKKSTVNDTAHSKAAAVAVSKSSPGQRRAKETLLPTMEETRASKAHFDGVHRCAPGEGESSPADMEIIVLSSDEAEENDDELSCVEIDGDAVDEEDSDEFSCAEIDGEAVDESHV